MDCIVDRTTTAEIMKERKTKKSSTATKIARRVTMEERKLSTVTGGASALLIKFLGQWLSERQEAIVDKNPGVTT